MSDQNEAQIPLVLGSNKNDHAAIFLKNIISFAVPVVGALLGDIVANQIPNQRLDRIENYFKIYADKVEKMPAEVSEKLKEKLAEPEAVPFVEEILKQVVASRTEEKRRYLASALSRGVLVYDEDELTRQKLIDLVGQLNELEIMRLYGASLDYHRNKTDYNNFWTDEREQIFFYEPGWTDGAESRRKEQISRGYSEKLVRLGLLTETNSDGRPTFWGAEVLKFIDIRDNLPNDLKSSDA